MRRSMRCLPAAVLVPVLVTLLPGCRNGLEWSPGPTPGGTASGDIRNDGSQPPPSPQPRTMTIVAVGGRISCRVDGQSLTPLTWQENQANAGAGEGRHLVVVSDDFGERIQSYSTTFDPNQPEIATQGRVTIRHINKNLFVTCKGAARIDITSLSDDDDADILDRAVAANDRERAAVILNLRPELIDQKNSKTGKTALIRAAESGNLDALDFLLARKANTEIRDNQGRTALHEAVYQGRSQAVTILVKRGADVNATTSEGETPRQLAISRGRTHIADYLDGAGARQTAVGQPGRAYVKTPTDRVFEIRAGDWYGPQPDGTAIQYAADHFTVSKGGGGATDDVEFDVPPKRDAWITLNGTRYMVYVRKEGGSRIWCRYKP